MVRCDADNEAFLVSVVEVFDKIVGDVVVDDAGVRQIESVVDQLTPRHRFDFLP